METLCGRADGEKFCEKKVESWQTTGAKITINWAF